MPFFLFCSGCWVGRRSALRSSDMPTLFRMAICLAFILEAIGQVTPQIHQLPARALRRALSPDTVVADPLQLPTSLAVRKIIIGISRPLLMQPGPPDPTASLILEPMTNGCYTVIVTNADADVTWTIQTSTNLACCWTDGLSMSNATSYVFTNCFPDGVDNMFLRLLDP